MASEPLQMRWNEGCLPLRPSRAQTSKIVWSRMEMRPPRPPPFPAHGCEEIRRRYGPSVVCVTAPASGLAAGVAVTHRRSREIVC